MLFRTLRNVALLTLAACATVTAACGLSVVGTTNVTEEDAGFDAAIDHTAHLPGDDDTDDDANTPTTKDGSVTDGGSDGPLDAADAADANETSTPPCPEVSGGSMVAGMFDGHCYFVLAGGARHGQEARDGCVAANAHLVTITSSAEQDFAKGLGDDSSSRWIGLTAATVSSSAAAFSWVTGEAVTYQNWDPDQPNGDGTCVVMKLGDSTWQDRVCTDFYLDGICERE